MMIETTTEEIHDFIAVGVGPFNLGLACLTESIDTLNGVFFDKKVKFDWHPGMMLEDTTLQIPFIADLVTLADPTNPFSFLNYSKEKGRLYSFYIRENFLLLRKEYNHYCQWAISKLSNIYFQTEVLDSTYNPQGRYYVLHTKNTKTGIEKKYKAKKLVLGTGTQPAVPDCCKKLRGQVIHSSQYLQNKERLQSKKAITVVGSGQSAAEIFYDLLQDVDSASDDDKSAGGYRLNWITRSPRFFPLEYSKLTLEMTSPEYVDYFYNLPENKRDALNKEQKQLYKGINQELIAAIFDLLYTKQLLGTNSIKLRTNSALEKVDYDQAIDRFYIEFYQHEQDKYYAHETEGLILATGYTYQPPKFIKGIADRIRWDDKGRYDTHRNYAIDHKGTDIFVQNAELQTHGFVTPDLGMACYRNSYIIKELTGKEYYPIEQRIAFQEFGVTAEEEIIKTAPVL